jgi:hypothetical protein
MKENERNIKENIFISNFQPMACAQLRIGKFIGVYSRFPGDVMAQARGGWSALQSVPS